MLKMKKINTLIIAGLAFAFSCKKNRTLEIVQAEYTIEQPLCQDIGTQENHWVTVNMDIVIEQGNEKHQVTYELDFGDGHTVSGTALENYAHTYTEEGSYTIKIRAYNKWTEDSEIINIDIDFESIAESKSGTLTNQQQRIYDLRKPLILDTVDENTIVITHPYETYSTNITLEAEQSDCDKLIFKDILGNYKNGQINFDMTFSAQYGVANSWFNYIGVEFLEYQINDSLYMFFDENNNGGHIASYPISDNKLNYNIIIYNSNLPSNESQAYIAIRSSE